MFLAGRFKPGDGALCSAHTFGNSVLSETCPRASLEHFVGKLILQLQGFIGLGKALSEAARDKCRENHAINAAVRSFNS